jgi:Ca2+-transporting ATPase
VFNARSDETSAFTRLFTNSWLWAGVGASLALHVGVIYTPFLQQAFSTTPLDAGDWLRCAMVASSVLWLREGVKALRRGRRRAEGMGTGADGRNGFTQRRSETE